MKLIALILSVIILSGALCSCKNEPIGEGREESMNVTLSRVEKVSSVPTVSTYNPQETMLSSEILELFYRQLDAIKAGDGEEYLAVFPEEYTDVTYPNKQLLEDFQKDFEKRAKSFVERMGADAELTLEVTDEALTDSGDAYEMTNMLKDEYGIHTVVKDTRKFVLDFRVEGDKGATADGDIEITAIKIGDKWYLPPETSLYRF